MRYRAKLEIGASIWCYGKSWTIKNFYADDVEV